MSDLSDMDDLPHALPRPVPPRTWRERIDALAAASDLTPARISAAVALLVVVGLVVWRLAAPPAPPPEMQLPFAEGSAATSDGSAAAPDAGTGPVPPAGGEVGPATTGGGEPTPGTVGGDGQVVVHVAGAVAAPGVQRLPAGARVIDAVDAAGGAAADADLARINLAAALVDGQQVYVVRVGEDLPPPPAGAPGGGGGVAGEGPGPDGLVDVNSASASELDELPGVGPTTAEAIISHREQHGAFRTVDDLLDVRGIGDAKLEQLRDLVTV